MVVTLSSMAEAVDRDTHQEHQRNLLGLRVEDWTWPELMATLGHSIQSCVPVNVWGVSVTMLSLTRKYPEIVDFSQEFDIVVADGAGVVRFGPLLGQKFRAHIGLPAIADALLRLAHEKGYRVLLFGTTPENNERACRAIQSAYPNLQLCPGIDGYYGPQQEEAVASRIRDSRPDIVLIGMSVPRKERFMLRWRDFMHVPVCVACGGYLDVLAGVKRMPPKFIEPLALSWLWRFLQEPRRTFSISFMGVVLFLAYLLPVGMAHRLLRGGQQPSVQQLFHLSANENRGEHETSRG